MQCSYTKQDNTQCKAQAIKGSEYCYFHNPDISKEEKSLVQQEGGLNRRNFIRKPLNTVEINTMFDIKFLLVDTINNLRVGNIDSKIASTIGYLSGQMLKTLELVDIEKRIEVLENHLLK